MNILLVYHELGFRGGEKLFANLCKGLSEKGHRVTFVCARVNKKSIALPKKIQLIKPPVLLNKLFENNWIFVLFSMPITFANILRHASKIDVIYSGETFTAFWPALMASKILAKKLVLSVYEVSKSKSIINLINNFLLEHVRYATTINSTLIPTLKNDFKIKKVHSIPAGIDFSVLRKPDPTKVIRKFGLEKNKVILMQGAIHPQKRQDLAIKAFRLVSKAVPNLKLIIVGGGDKAYLERLNLSGIIFAGFIPEHDIKDYYSVADVCIMCGPIGGLTIVEALFFNKITVYPSSGTPPLGPVEEYNLGEIIYKKTHTAFAAKILEILKKPEKYSKKITDDRKKALKIFSLKRFTSDTLRVLEAEK